MDHKEQYQSYLAQAMSALEHACAHFLPEESEVCRAARYSLMGGGKRIRAVLVLSVCDMLGGNMQAAEQFASAVECCIATRSSMMICPAWIMMICAVADLPAIKLLTRRPLCWPAMFF